VLPVNEEIKGSVNFEHIRLVISKSASYLDEQNYTGFVQLFSENARYILEARSSEIGEEMNWLDLSRDELSALLEESPQHIHDLAERMHLISVDEIIIDTSGDTANVKSTFSVFRTDTAGITQVYAVGRYYDSLLNMENVWRIKERIVKVQTRMFRTPTPTPL
jgi:3-phenylpropionate/cinnamic acid dioxygenase small subunit